MEFRLLGPVEVITDQGPLELGRRRERGVLAILLLEVGQPVPIERLVELLFDDDPPRDPRKAVQVDISRLRRSLSAVADEETVRLTSEPSGYVMHTARETVDAHRFAALVESARDTDERAERSRLLHEALALWRGPALIELADSVAAQPFRARLDELRLAAIELHADTDLALGRHAELVAELTDLTVQYPNSERLVAAQMLALYRSGRKRDALDVYQDAADRLVEELGLDPGPDLRKLHLAILRDDEDALAVDSPGVEATRLAVRPAQLPADLPQFTGRDDELASLIARSRLPHDTVVISSIDGMAGIGKTALAVHAAHQLAPDYPDGQLFIDLNGHTEGVEPVSPGEALDRLLRSLGVPDAQIPPSTDERAALYRSVLADKRLLILLDNAATEQQVEPLLPGVAGSLALVTSRSRLAGLDQTSPLSLDVLPAGDATALFHRVAGVDRLADEPSELVDEVVELCGRLPLAIRIAAARLRTRTAWSLAYLRDRLRDEQHRLAELEVGNRDVAGAFQLSYRQLTEPQARMFRLLTLNRGTDVDTHGAAALAGCDERAADQLLDDLLDAHLLQQHRPRRFRFHDLLRTYATERARTTEIAELRNAAVARLFGYYIATTAVATDLLYPYEASRRPKAPTDRAAAAPEVTEPGAALAWLDTELDGLLANAEHGPATQVVPLSQLLCRHLHTRGRYADDESLHRIALDLARASGDHGGQVRALTGLGRTRDMLGRHSEATDDYRAALELARQTRDQVGELDALIGLGRSTHINGPMAPAMEFYQQGLTLARKLGDEVGEFDALTGIAHINTTYRRMDDARQGFERLLAIARRIDDRARIVAALVNLGSVNSRLDELDAAEQQYEEGLELARQIGHASGEVRGLHGLGQVYRRQRRYDLASQITWQAYDRAGDIGDRNYQFESLLSLGLSMSACDRDADALPLLEEALQLARDLEQPYDQASAAESLGDSLQQLGRHDEARRRWNEALEIFTAIGVPQADRVRSRLARRDQSAPA